MPRLDHECYTIFCTSGLTSGWSRILFVSHDRASIELNYQFLCPAVTVVIERGPRCTWRSTPPQKSGCRVFICCSGGGGGAQYAARARAAAPTATAPAHATARWLARSCFYPWSIARLEIPRGRMPYVDSLRRNAWVYSGLLVYASGGEKAAPRLPRYLHSEI